jgi:RHS repeat-associated protein
MITAVRQHGRGFCLSVSGVALLFAFTSPLVRAQGQLTVFTYPSGSIAYGQSVNVRVSGCDPNGGTLTIYENGSPVATNSSVWSPSSPLPIGTYSFSAVLVTPGGTFYSNTSTLTVVASTPTVSVTCTPNLLVANTVTSSCIAVLSSSSTPTGTVAWSISGPASTAATTALSNGSTTLSSQFGGYPAGSYTVTASYSGDSNNNPASSSTNMLIFTAPPSTPPVTIDPAQAPLLGSIEAPYPDLNSTVHIAGHVYGPGAVAYGPPGTPLVISGKNLGSSGTVNFVGYKNGAVDSGATATAIATFHTPTIIFVTVPAGAKSGLVTVTSENTTSNGLPFIVTQGSYAAYCPGSPPQSQLQIVTSSLENGSVGQPYSATLSATGIVGSAAWSLIGGTLPAGLSLSSSGVLSGTPTVATSVTDLTIQLTSNNVTTEAVLSLAVDAPALTSAPGLYVYTAGYDGVGNVTSYDDSVMGAWSFQYDTLNRLQSGSATTGGYASQNLCWAYDDFGNRTLESLQSTACVAGTPPAEAYYSNNQVNNGLIGYDAAGDIQTDAAAGNQYIYDAEGRVCAVASSPVAGIRIMTGYMYNAEGIRVGKGTISAMSCDVTTNGFQLTHSYVLGLGGEELTTMGPSGTGQSGWRRTNVYGAGKLLATYDLVGSYGSRLAGGDGSGSSETGVGYPALHFHLADPLGTRRMQVSGNLTSAGVPELDCQSLPFGNQQNCTTDPNATDTADDATPMHFTAKERDSESGNDYFEARYYSSAMGRFMSPDWAAKEDPVPYATFDDPQSLNLYSYVKNNPLSHADADGHCCDWNSIIIGSTTALGGIAGAVGGAAAGAGAGAGTLVVPGVGTISGGVYLGTLGAATGATFGNAVGNAIVNVLNSSNSSTTPLPTGPVGTDPQATEGSRTKSGPLAPEHGGSGEAGKDFGTLTGGNSAPAAPEKRYPAGTQVGENGIALRPAKGTSGPKIDIPANGSKPHETLHYPPPPPPPTQPK